MAFISCVLACNPSASSPSPLRPSSSLVEAQWDLCWLERVWLDFSWSWSLVLTSTGVYMLILATRAYYDSSPCCTPHLEYITCFLPSGNAATMSSRSTTRICTCQKFCQAPPKGRAIPLRTWYYHAAQHVQWVKKLSQCLALLKRLVWRKSNKLHNNLKIIYVILDYLGFWTHF